MSKISIKTDFKNGEKLFDTDLNNNFKVIQAGINANEENLQEVIDEAIVRLDAELEAITADRGWDWNGGDRVTFYKGNTSEVDSREIVNGQMLYNTDTGETALDDNGNRIVTGSGNVVAISSTQPTNEATKDWIKPITINGTETAEEYFKNNNNEWVKILTQPSGDTLPIGSIAQFGGENAPTNWLFCNGQAVSRETYAELFSVIGTTYGDGDGSTTFNLPDFSSRSPMGVGTGTDGTNSETTTLGQEKGEYTHQLTVHAMPSHNHTLGTNINCTAFGTNNSLARGTNGSFEDKDAQNYIKNTGGNQAHNTVHPILGVNFIIKAKQSIGIVGTVSEDITDTNNNAVPTCETVKNYVDEKQTYSETETVIGTWLGKPLYRKVVDLGNLPNNTSKTVSTGLNMSTISLVKISGYAKSQTGYGFVSMPKSDITFQVTLSNGDLYLSTSENYSTWTGWAILEYTKTTD